MIDLDGVRKRDADEWPILWNTDVGIDRRALLAYVDLIQQNESAMQRRLDEVLAYLAALREVAGQVIEAVDSCAEDTWECAVCGRSEPWWVESNLEILTREAIADLRAMLQERQPNLCVRCNRPADQHPFATCDGRQGDVERQPEEQEVCVACGKPWDGEKCGQAENGWPFPVCTPGSKP